MRRKRKHVASYIRNVDTIEKDIIIKEKHGVIDRLKSDYPWLYRALRTFLQTFISVSCTEIATRGVDEITKKALFAIITAAGAAAIAAVMNIPPKEEEV